MPIAGNTQVDDTLQIWLGALCDLSYLGRIPNFSEVLEPAPPLHDPWEPPPLRVLPPVRLQTCPPPPHGLPKVFAPGWGIGLERAAPLRMAALATSSRQPAGPLPSVPFPSTAAVQATSTGLQWSCEVLHTWPCGASGRGGGGGCLGKRPTGVVGTPRAAAVATGRAPLHIGGGSADSPPPSAICRTPSPPARRRHVQRTLPLVRLRPPPPKWV